MRVGLFLYAFEMYGCAHRATTSVNIAESSDANVAILESLKGWNIQEIHVSISNRSVAVQIVGVQEAKSEYDLSAETYAAVRQFIVEKHLRIHDITVSTD